MIMIASVCLCLRLCDIQRGMQGKITFDCNNSVGNKIYHIYKRITALLYINLGGFKVVKKKVKKKKEKERTAARLGKQ